jgi:hypothetical protein
MMVLLKKKWKIYFKFQFVCIQIFILKKKGDILFQLKINQNNYITLKFRSLSLCVWVKIKTYKDNTWEIFIL